MQKEDNLIASSLKNFLGSNLFKSSSVYTIAGFLNSALPLLLLPFLTDKLSPADYGIVAMFQLIISFLYPFVGLNLEAAIAREYFDLDKNSLSKYIGNCILLSIASISIIFSIIYLGNEYVEKIFSVPNRLIYSALIVCFFQFIIAISLSIFQISQKPYPYVYLQLSQTFINAILTLFFIYYLKETWNGRINAQIFTFSLFALISFLYLKIRIKLIFHLSKKNIKKAITFGLPLVPHALGAILFTAIDRIFLTKLFGLEQTGNFSIAFQLGAVISLLTNSFNNAFVPWLYNNLNKNSNEINLKIVKNTYYYFILIFMLAFILTLTFPFIVKIFVNKKYSNINFYSFFIIIGFVFQGMYFMVTNYITYAKKTYIQAIITFFVALLKIPITYFSLKQLGPIGASISFGLTYFIFFIITWIYSTYVFPMPWNIFKKINLISN